MVKRNEQEDIPGETGRRRDGFFFYRKVCWKTTWLFRLILLFAVLLVLLAAKGPALRAIGESLVIHVGSEHCDAVLIENFDPNYLLFEESRKLLNSGMDAGVFVPVPYNRGKSGPNRVSAETVSVMAEVSRIGDYRTINIPETEPIRYNAALAIGGHLQSLRIGSVMLGFQSGCFSTNRYSFRFGKSRSPPPEGGSGPREISRTPGPRDGGGNASVSSMRVLPGDSG